jgi:antitoxin (DNA-binding transcriptional repressor) of toxin-antitoxin stability system
MAKTISATRAARTFSDLLARVRYRGEEFVVEKGGEPMCRVVPVRAGNVRSTAAGFADALRRGPHPDKDYLDAVEKVTRKQAKVPRSRWGR